MSVRDTGLSSERVRETLDSHATFVSVSLMTSQMRHSSISSEAFSQKGEREGGVFLKCATGARERRERERDNLNVILKYMQHLKSRVHGALPACMHHLEHAHFQKRNISDIYVKHTRSEIYKSQNTTSQTCTINLKHMQHLKHATSQTCSNICSPTYAQSQTFAASQTRNITNTQHHKHTTPRRGAPGTLAPPSQDSKQPWYHS